MPTKQNKNNTTKIVHIAGIEIQSRKELVYVLSSMTTLIASIALFIFAIIKTYFLYQDIKKIQQENRFLKKQLSIITSMDMENIRQQFDLSTEQLPQHLNLSELANHIKQQAIRHGLDIIQLSVTEEITVHEEQINDNRLNKTIIIKKVYIPIQLKGSLNNQIKFLEYIHQQDTNLWFNEIRLNQTQALDDNTQLVTSPTWILRIQLLQIVFPHIKLAPNEIPDLIHHLRFKNTPE